MSAVAGTNYCQIGLKVDEKRKSIVVLSALDPVGKGVAASGYGKYEYMFGIDRTAGLIRRGLHPN